MLLLSAMTYIIPDLYFKRTGSRKASKYQEGWVMCKTSALFRNFPLILLIVLASLSLEVERREEGRVGVLAAVSIQAASSMRFAGPIRQQRK